MPIDVHCHLIPEDYLREAQRPGNVYGERITRDAATGADFLHPRQGQPYRLRPSHSDPEALLEDQKQLGVDFSLLCPSPTIVHDWLDPAAGRDHCRLVNEGMAAAQRQFGARFACLGTVPLQDPESAVAELEYAVRGLGLLGVTILTNVAGRNLDEPELLPFFRRAGELGAVVLLHPWHVAGAERMTRHYLVNAVGNPMDLAIAVGSLIFGGVLDSCPGLKLLVVHGGGAAPFIAGRLDRAWRIKAECRERIDAPPSSYLSRLWYDTITHDVRALKYLVETVGVGRVLLGSDVPFHVFGMGDPEPLVTVAALGLSPADRQRVTDGNARDLLALPAAPGGRT